MHYFDNAATTKISTGALDAYTRTSLETFANPSASYSSGRESKALLEDCRSRIATVLGTKAERLFFTSGATESIGIVMSSLLWAKSPGKVIISAMEHEAVSSWTGVLKEHGWTVETVGAKGGFVSAEALYDKIDKSTRLVAIMAVNNVLGTIQDLPALVKVVRDREKEFGRPIFFFSDSVQALGKTDYSLSSLDIDGASFSAHKIHGPRGCGLLYLKKGQIQALSHGGGQEKGVRGGTENLPAIAAFAEAVEELKTWDAAKVKEMNGIVREACKKAGYRILSAEEHTTPYILSVSGKWPSEVALRMLQDKGFLVSSGSACSNNARGKAEGLLRSCGFGDAAGGAIRISFSSDTTMEQTEALARALGDING